MASGAIGYAVLPIIPSVSGLGTTLASQLRAPTVAAAASTGKAAGASLASKIVGGVKRVVAPVAAVGVAAGAAILTGFVLKGGISRALNIEDAQKKLVGLGHSSASVTKIMGNALDAVRGTSYGLDTAATVAASAVAAGIKPGKQLTAYLKTTADAATIAGTSLGSMGSIFGKVQASGKVYTDTLNQLSDQGVPIFAWLQKSYGVSADKLSDMVKAGEVDSGTFMKVIRQNIGGAALTAGETTRGAWANLQAAGSRLGASIVSGPIKALPGLFTSAGGAVDRANAALAPYTAALGSKLQGVLTGLAGKLDHLPIEQIVTRIAVAGSGVVRWLGTASHAVTDFLHGFVTPPDAIIINGKSLISSKQVGELTGFAGAGQKAAVVVGQIAGVVRGFAGGIRTAVTSLGAGKGLDLSGFGAAGKTLSDIRTVVTPLWPVLVQVGTAVGGVAGSFGKLIAAGLPILPPILNLLAGVVGFVADNMGKLVPYLPLIAAGLIGWRVATQATLAANRLLTAAQIAALPVQTLNNAQRLIAARLELQLAAANGLTTTSIVGNTLATARQGAATLLANGRALAAAGAAKVVAAGQAIATAATSLNTGALAANGLAMARAGIAAAASKVVLIGGAVATGVATAAQWLFNAALDANPIGIVVLAIAALVAGIVWFVTQTKVGQAVWQAVSSFFVGAWNWMLAVGAAVFKAIGVAVTVGIGVAKSVISTVVGWIVGYWRLEWAILTTVATVVFTAVKTVVNAGVNVAKSVISTVIGWISNFWSLEVKGWQIVIAAVFAAVKLVVTTEIAIVRSVISTAVGFVTGVWSTGWHAVSSVISGVWSTITGAVSGGVSKVVAFVTGLGGKVKAAAVGFASLLLNTGRDIVAGLVSGITNSASSVITAARNLANLLPEWARKVLGIHSPSTVFRAIGDFVGKGLVTGLAGTRSAVAGAGVTLVQQVTNAFANLHAQTTSAQKTLHKDQVAYTRELADVPVLHANAAGKITASAQAAYQKQVTTHKQQLADLRAQVKDQKSTVAALTAAASKSVRTTVTQLVASDTAKLAALAKTRDGIAANLKTAQKTLSDAMGVQTDYASSVSGSVAGLGNITSATGVTSTDGEGNQTTAAVTANDVISNLQAAVNSTTAFTSQLTNLKAMGLNDTTYKQLVDAFTNSGDTTFANALLSGGSQAVATVNGLQAQLSASATQLGVVTSTALYQAGINIDQAAVNGLTADLANVTGAMGLVELNLAGAVAKLGVNTKALTTAAGADVTAGLITGIKSKRTELADALSDMSKAAIKKLRKTLGIKSPSTYAADQVGQWLPAGVAVGIKSNAGVVDDAFADLTPRALQAPGVSLADLFAGTSGLPAALDASTTGARRTDRSTHLEIHGNVGWDAEEAARRVQEASDRDAALEGLAFEDVMVA